MKKEIIFVYSICVLVGCLISFFAIDLQPSTAEKPVVDVIVKSAEPVIIRDTITKTDVKYKYVYRNRCCCEICNKDTVR